MVATIKVPTLVSGGYLPSSHRRHPGSIPDLS